MIPYTYQSCLLQTFVILYFRFIAVQPPPDICYSLFKIYRSTNDRPSIFQYPHIKFMLTMYEGQMMGAKWCQKHTVLTISTCPPAHDQSNKNTQSSQWAPVLRPTTSQTLFSPHNEHLSSSPRPVKLCLVLTMSTCPPAHDQSNFV